VKSVGTIPHAHDTTREVESITKELKVNEQIRVRQVRLIAADGEQVGIVETRDALRRAREEDLDLVERAALESADAALPSALPAAISAPAPSPVRLTIAVTASASAAAALPRSDAAVDCAAAASCCAFAASCCGW